MSVPVDAMRWASATSTRGSAAEATAEVVSVLGETLGSEPVDLAIAFFRAEHVEAAEAIASGLKLGLRPECLAGASGHGVVTTAHEIEQGPALTVIAARLPGVEVNPFLLTTEGWSEAWEDPLLFAQLAPGVSKSELVILLGDPFSLDVESVLAAFNRHVPGVRVVGGMASAGPRPRTNVLFLNDWISDEGGLAISLRGDLRVDVVVSQGCRPIGPTLEVTRADGNLVFELDGQPALERAEQVLRGLKESERERLRQGLYVGRPARGGAAGPGDWIIRNLLGADRDRGVLAVGDRFAPGDRMRLHARDAEAAREDLEMLLSPQVVDVPARAAFLFACNSRGQGLYGAPDGDIEALQAALGGGVPAAGMFCAGEIGPVGEKNFLHGHTASIALVRPGAATRG